MLNQKNLILIFSFLFYLLPAALITGPFLSDLIITLLGIFFLIYSLRNKQWSYYNNISRRFISKLVLVVI